MVRLPNPTVPPGSLSTPSWYPPPSLTTTTAPKTHRVPAAHGFAFSVRPGTRFRIVDLHGEQVVDMMAWVGATTTSSSSSSSSAATHTLPAEHLSMSYTRYHLSGVTPSVGDHLYTNADKPLLKLTADTCKTHDMTFMSCNPSMLLEFHLPATHRSCATNIAEAMQPYGMRSWLDVADPFNVFQNTPNYTLKPLGCSRPGDYVEFEVVGRDVEGEEQGEEEGGDEHVVVAVSCCPWDVDGFNGGKITDVAVVMGIVP